MQSLVDASLSAHRGRREQQIAVESRFNGHASKGNPRITEAILKCLETFLIFYFDNNRNPPIVNKRSLEIR